MPLHPRGVIRLPGTWPKTKTPGWWQSVRLPVVHCRTHSHRSLGPATLSCPLLCICCTYIPFVSSFQLYANCSFLHKNMSLWLVLLLVSVWGPKQKGPVQPAAAAFAPPPQCNATKHSKQSDLTSGLSLSLSLQCLRKVKICGSALQYESAAGPQTPGKQSNANAATTCLPRPSQACRPPWVNLCLYFCATFWALPARCLPMMSC